MSHHRQCIGSFCYPKNYELFNPSWYTQGQITYAHIVDASTGTETVEGGMEIILTQMDKDRKFHAISNASKQLIKHENNCFTFLLELDAVV
jgi:hypothetical protein